ncbi:MAG: DapH/DapD/GlmU-related protein [Candidatus Bathyarchaeia archaeon]
MLGKDAKISSQAYIQEGTKIGSNVRIGPFSQILAGSIILDDCIVGSHCITGHPSKLQLQEADFSATSSKVTDFIIKDPVTQVGKGSIIRSGSAIYKHVTIGRNLRTGHGVLIREHVTIGDNCVVGTQAILDGYIKLGSRSMVQSQCYVAQSVRIGKGVFVSPGCMFFDNKRIILGQGLQGATIEDYARIGGGTKILPGITIGKYALIGAGSVVTKDIPSKAIVSGIPAKVKGFQTDEELEVYVDSVMKWE